MTDQTGVATSATPCRICGAHALEAKHQQHTRKRRSKFGLLWLIAKFLTLGVALVAYIIWPRHSEVVSVEHYLQCRQCGARQ